MNNNPKDSNIFHTEADSIDIKQHKFGNKISEFKKLIEQLYDECENEIKLEEWLENMQNYNDRIFYSEITSYMVTRTQEEHNNILLCLERLLEKDLKDNKYTLLLKLYDHIQLVYHQLNIIDNKIQKQGDFIIDEMKSSVIDKSDELQKEFVEKIEEQTKRILETEKNYISILGIFASIIIAFTAGMTFNTSVLLNMDKVSIYRLTYVIILISQGTIHLVYLLIGFIYKITKDKKYEYPDWLYIFDALSVIIILVVCFMYKINI